MRRYSRYVAVLTLFCLPLAAAGQDRPRRVATPDEAVSLEAALVEVPVVVSDRAGRYVANLYQSDFVLYEDGEPQEIAYFGSDRVPIHVALLLDTSSSTRDSLDEIQHAAVEFLEQLLPDDRVMVLSFDGDLRVDQEFTSDRRRLERAIERTKTRKGTKLYDSVVFAVAERLRDVEGRKAIVLLSDGEDSRSDASFEEAVRVCVESDVAVYGIRYPHEPGGVFGLPIPGTKGKGVRFPRVPKIPGIGWPLAPAGTNGDFMETVTASTGGRLYESKTIRDLGSLFAAIAEELRHVYVLGYAPTNPVANGGFRTISVRVPPYPDLVVRHRLGYRAVP
jgi:VWFA-related protein